MSGGGPARRAILRWAVRLFRREWRQQVIVLALLSLAVGAAVAGSAIAVNAGSTSAGQFGSGGALVGFDAEPGVSADAQIDAARTRFGELDVIAHTSTAVPGSSEVLDVRDQDPHGVFSAPMLGVVSGRYPSAAGEVALSRPAAELFDAGVGTTVTVSRSSVTVVGIVENPAQLDDTFVLAAPGTIAEAASYSLLVADERIAAGLAAGGPGSGQLRIQNSGEDTAPIAAAILVATTLALSLVALVAAAGFVVVAQRRQRQLGLLGAIGATRRHVRLVMVCNGLIVGVVAAVVGGALGLVGWFISAPAVETAANHRIGRLDVPWMLVTAIMLIAAAMATLAAWQPARSASRQSVMSALSGRPTPPRPVHRSLVVAAIFLAVGTAAIVTSDATTRHVRPQLLIAGVLAVVVGAIFASPAAVRSLGVLARRLPFAPRLALRDLARHQARAAAALAAITLGLGIAVSVIAVAAASAADPSQGNLSSHELLIRLGNTPTSGGDASPADGESVAVGAASDAVELDARAATIVAALGDGYTSVPLDVAYATSADGTLRSEVPAILGVAHDDHSIEHVTQPYVATPAVLAAYGIDASAIDADTEILTSRDDALLLFAPPAMVPGGLPDKLARPDLTGPPATTQHVDLPSWREAPGSLITEAAMVRLGLVAARSAWIVESSDGFTASQISAARAAAAEAGLTVETRDNQDSLQSVRTWATAIGALLAIAVVAMTVGLIRAESVRDIRTLTATGAAARTRRAVTASTAAALAALGVVLGVGGAYVALLAAFHADLGRLAPVPFDNLLALAIGLPVLATVFGWLLAGREPTTFSRRAMD